jgi:hypothetical protein
MRPVSIFCFLSMRYRGPHLGATISKFGMRLSFSLAHLRGEMLCFTLFYACEVGVLLLRWHTPSCRCLCQRLTFQLRSSGSLFCCCKAPPDVYLNHLIREDTLITSPCQLLMLHTSCSCSSCSTQITLC